MQKRMPWHQYFLAQSILISMRSTCNRLAVGATIVKEKRVISGGYNGSVSGEDHCADVGCYIEDGHCLRTIHAEANAILQCSKFGVSTKGASIYVTHFPCLQCTKHIIQAGVKHIYYLEDYKNHPYALELLEKDGIRAEKIALDKNVFKEMKSFMPFDQSDKGDN